VASSFNLFHPFVGNAPQSYVKTAITEGDQTLTYYLFEFNNHYKRSQAVKVRIVGTGAENQHDNKPSHSVIIHHLIIAPFQNSRGSDRRTYGVALLAVSNGFGTRVFYGDALLLRGSVVAACF
jgi:hypothetical protein